VLQDLRVRLHLQSGRREDRLVFDHQIEIARQLRLSGSKSLAASDLLMRRYYLAAKAIWRFNQILLANLYARIVPREERKFRVLDDDFQLVDYTLGIRDPELFEREPGKMLEAFVRLQRDRGIANLSAGALRAISRALPRIDRAFREDPENRRRFLETLRRMSRYGAARPLHPGLRTHRRPHAARPLPRLHRGRAHPDGRPEPPALRDHRDGARIPAVLEAS
jgi:[protein-PII] uridylyltransferase